MRKIDPLRGAAYTGGSDGPGCDSGVPGGGAGGPGSGSGVGEGAYKVLGGGGELLFRLGPVDTVLGVPVEIY